MFKELKWKIFKNLARKLGVKVFGGLAYLIVIDLELGSFREDVYDKHGFFKSFHYIVNYDVRLTKQMEEKERLRNTIDEDFVLRDNTVVEDMDYLVDETQYLYAQIHYETGVIYYRERPTNYRIDPETDELYFKDEVIATIERVRSGHVSWGILNFK